MKSIILAFLVASFLLIDLATGQEGKYRSTQVLKCFQGLILPTFLPSHLAAYEHFFLCNDEFCHY
jgi:hypothetical protein